MTEKDLHLQINELLDNDLNADRIKKLEAKQKPKTKVQRLRGVYWLLFSFGGLSQLLGVILASTGVMYYLSTKLSSNGFFLAVTAAVLLLGLEVAKHIVLKGYHSQRLDDKHVSHITYSLIAFLLLINSFFAYVGTPHAIEYFTEKPTLISLDSIAAKEDVVLAANIATIESEIAKHDTTANKIFTSASWLQKLSNKDRPAYQTALNAKAQAEKMKTAVRLRAATDKALALKEAEKENKARMNDYLAWCMSFGAWLALLSLAFDFVFFFGFWFCENYTRLEVKEYNAILALRDKAKLDSQNANSNSTAKDDDGTAKDGTKEPKQPKKEHKNVELERQVSELEIATAKTDMQIKFGNDGKIDSQKTTKQCEFDGCKKPFLHNVHNQRFCSDSCRKKNHLANKKTV